MVALAMTAERTQGTGVQTGFAGRFGRDGAAYAVLVLACLAVFAEAFSGGWLVQRDLLRLTYPYRDLAAEIWAAGSLPAWNSAAGLGTPLLADPVAGVLDPGTLLFLLPVPLFAIGTGSLVLRYALAGLLMYRFLKMRGLDPVSSLVGGLGYMLAGFSIGSWTMFQWVAALPLLPLALAAARAPGVPLGRGAAAGAVFALFLFSGAPEPLLAALVLWVLEVDAARRDAGRAPRAAVVEVVAGLVFAAGFGLAQILPTLELLGASDRWGGRGSARALSYSVTPLVGTGHILPIVFPAEDGGPAPAGLFPFAHPLYFSTYVGFLLLVLASVGASGSRDEGTAGGRRRWAVAAAFGWLVAYGSTIPGVAALVERWPWMTVIGFPVKAFVIVPPCLAILAALGCRDLAAPGADRRVPIALASVVALVVLLVALGIVLPSSLLGPESDAWLVASMTSRFIAASRHVLVVALAAVIVLVGVIPRQRALGRILLALLVALDLGAAGRGVLFWGEESLRRPPPIRDAIPDAWPRILTTAEDDFAGGSSGAERVHAMGDVAAGIPWRIRHVGLYASFQDLAWNRWWDGVVADTDGGLRRLGAVGVRWFVCDELVAPRAEAAGFRATASRAIPMGGARILAHPAPLAEARFYPGGAMPDERRLSERGEPVIDAVHHLDGRMEARLEADTAGWVYRAETWFPGWGALVDGRWVSAVPAPGMPGQLVAVEAGAHRLEWVYRSSLIEAGLMGSLGAAILAALVLLRGRFRSRGARPGPARG